MDIWGAGCIMFELTALYPLFPGKDEADQIYRIHSVLGTPNASIVERLRKHAWPEDNFTFTPKDGISLSKLLPSASKTYMDLLSRSVAYDAPDRITADQALKRHPYFASDETFPSATATGIARSRRDKIIGVAPNPAKVAESKRKNELVVDEAKPHTTKPRSMVSILLARVRPVLRIAFYNLSYSYSLNLYCIPPACVLFRTVANRKMLSKNQESETILSTRKEETVLMIICHKWREQQRETVSPSLSHCRS
jgi:serine/threonine protein kinase